MKKTILTLLTAVLTTVGAAAQGTWKLHIALDDQPDTVMIALRNTDGLALGKMQPLVSTNKQIDYELPTTDVRAVYLFIKRQTVSTLAVPGETLTITGTMANPVLKGSAFYDRLDAVEQQVISPFKAQYDSIQAKVKAMRTAGVARDSVNSYYVTQVKAMQKAQSAAALDYIKAHPTDELSAFLVTCTVNEQVTEARDALSPEVREGRMRAIYQPFVKYYQSMMQSEENRKKIVAGNPAPDFTLDDIHGQKLALSSLRGKYVVLDFWGSWCGWCIKGMPKMKEYYTKYQGKFEILGVDCNDSPEKWKAAVEKHQLPWLHVYNTDAVDVPTRYGITGYPTKIVVDPKGVIAKVVVGEDPEFYTYLDHLFGGK